MSEQDKHIVDEVLRGNEESFAVLVRKYQDRALTLALRMVGDRRQAEEIVQDAFMRAYRHLRKFRGDATFHTWLYRIVHNLSLTTISKRKSDQLHLDIGQFDEGGAEIAVAEEGTAHDALEAVEQREIVAAEIDRLPEKYRTAVTLFYLQEMSYEEIAGIMEVPMGTLKTYLYRGRSLLARNVLARCRDGAHAA